MRDFLDKASAAYEEGRPIISDGEFDRLSSLVGYYEVGANLSGKKAIPHLHRMYSLQKCYENEELIQLPDAIVKTPKLDGAAISILYIEGQLALALTRGNGKEGHDITEKIALLVPNSIPRGGAIQISGEIVVPEHIANARNLAAGSLNLNDLAEFKTRPLKFIAYKLEPFLHDTFREDMQQLEEWSFNVVINNNHTAGYPTDGTVFRVDSNSVFAGLGFTSKHPRGAFALKAVPQGIITTLLDVVWEVGRTGTVNPVAILEPVMIEDALVSRATLHNIRHIDELGLELGCQVEVIRSGQIIPKIIGRV